jgi:protein O-mannosyl-transferase
LQNLVMRMRRHAPLVVVALGMVVAVAAYLQSLDYPFVNDDKYYVIENTKLAGLHFAELWRLFVEPFNPYEFLPLRDLSYWFDITLFGLTTSAFRVHNIILYLLCLPLVYATTLGLWRYFRPSDYASAPWAAAAVTALFAVNPSHVEAVVWISGRKDVLSTLFSLLALWFALKAKREHGLSPGYATTTLVALLAAMLSKATAVAVAPVIAMLWVFFWRDIPIQNRQRSVLLWPIASLLLALCIALIFSAYSAAKAPAYFGFEVITRALAILGWMVRLVVSPGNRHFMYPVFEDPYLPVMVTIGIAILVSAIAGVVMVLRKRSLEGFALIVFVLLCIPYIQLIPYKTHSLVSDRFLTLAVWPAVLLIVSLSWRFRLVIRTALIIAIFLLWSFQTIERPRDWRSYEALWVADLRDYPGHYLPAYEVITMYQLTKGQFREAEETANNIITPEARSIMKKMVEVAKDLSDASSTGDPREAMTHLQNLEQLFKYPPEQIKWDPTMQYFWYESLSSFVLEWQELVKHFPDNPEVRANARLSLISALKYGSTASQSR